MDHALATARRLAVWHSDGPQPLTQVGLDQPPKRLSLLCVHESVGAEKTIDAFLSLAQWGPCPSTRLLSRRTAGPRCSWAVRTRQEPSDDLLRRYPSPAHEYRRAKALTEPESSKQQSVCRRSVHRFIFRTLVPARQGGVQGARKEVDAPAVDTWQLG